MRNQQMSTGKDKKCDIWKKTKKDVQRYKLHMNIITSRDSVSVTKAAHNVKSKGNVGQTKIDPTLARSVSKPDHQLASSSNDFQQTTMGVKDCMISSKNKKNPILLKSNDNSNEVGCPKQSHNLSSNHIENSTLKAMTWEVQKESGINNCSSSKVTWQTKPDQVEAITSNEDGIVKVIYPKTSLDGTQFLQKHKDNLRNPCLRIFGMDISNCQWGASQMVGNIDTILSHNDFDRMEFKQANSEVCNMKQLANKDRETSNGSRGPLMEGNTQATDDIHIEGVVHVDNQTCRPLKKSRNCSITIEHEDEQVEATCGDQNVVGGEDDAARSTPQTKIWKDSQAEFHVPNPIDKPIWSGIFKINSKEYISLVGHLSPKSSKISQKLSGSLPPIVDITKLSRSEVWPKEWEKSKPNDNNISLYFFPHKTRVDHEQDQLVNELMENDLALCAIINEVEMLIFTSTLLPQPYQTFETKQYLWGVFKPKKDKGIIVAEPLTAATCGAKEVEKEPQPIFNKPDDVRLGKLGRESIFVTNSLALEEQRWPHNNAEDDKIRSLQGPQSMDFEPKFSQEIGQGDSPCYPVHTAGANTIATRSTTIPINDMQLDPITGFSKSKIYFLVTPHTPRFEELIRELEREGAVLWKGRQ